MKRSSLFVTVFLWFLATILLSVAVSFGLTILMTRQGIVLTGEEEVLSKALSLRGRECLGILERDGLEALSATARTIRRETGFSMFFFHPDGRSVFDDEPEFVRKIGRRAIESLEEGRSFETRNDFTIVTERMKAASGREYVVVGSFHRPPPVLRVIAEKRVPFAVYLAGFLATALLLCFLLARHISDPLTRLTDAARKLAEGKLDADVDEGVLRRKDEFGELAGAFSRSSRYIRELLDAQKRLIRDISHELRTPLARLGVALELARKKAPAAEDALARIETEASILNDMIGQLLSLSRLEVEMGNATFEPGDFELLVGKVVEDARFEARPSGKGILFRSEGREWILPMREEILRGAVENILRNALRYTPDGTAVDVSVVSDAKGVSLRIQDHGPGAPEDELEKIFLPFYRTEAARTRDTGGTGIGLAIAQRAVQQHGGVISASNAKDGGLVVEIVLPRAKKAA